MPTGSLPESGKKLWEKVYNEALKGSCKGDKECAAVPPRIRRRHHAAGIRVLRRP